MSYSTHELCEMYHQLAMGRIFTLKMHEAVKTGKIRSSFHTPYGQEAIDVGVINAMRKTDWFAPSHRDQIASIMRLDPYQYICEIFGKADGVQKGINFDFHANDFGNGRILPPDGLLGSICPTYTGFAWARRKAGYDDVVVIFLGDGAFSEGACYEAMNLAALYQAPVVIIVENNGWAMTVPFERQSANPNLAERAVPMGLEAMTVQNGCDVLEVRETLEKAIEHARGGKPTLVEIKCLRWEAHFFGQPNDYREDLDLVAEQQENNDPLKNFERYLLDNSIMSQADMDAIKQKLDVEFEEYVKKADACPPAKFEEIFRKDLIYATVETGGDL